MYYKNTLEMYFDEKARLSLVEFSEKHCMKNDRLLVMLPDIILLVFYYLIEYRWNYVKRTYDAIRHGLVGTWRCEQIVYSLYKRYRESFETILFERAGTLVKSFDVRRAIDELLKMGLLAECEDVTSKFLINQCSPVVKITDEGIEATEEFIIPLVRQSAELGEMHEILRSKLHRLRNLRAGTISRLLSDPSFWTRIEIEPTIDSDTHPSLLC